MPSWISVFLILCLVEAILTLPTGKRVCSLRNKEICISKRPVTYSANFEPVTNTTDIRSSNPSTISSINNALISSLSGAISCSVTHSMLVPLDVIKLHMQTDAAYARMNIFQVIQKLISKSGFSVFLDGLSATCCGYYIQGACKFGFYEYFKAVFLSPTRFYYKTAIKFRLPIYLLSSTLAETISSVALCPLETTKLFLISHGSENRGQNLLHVMSIIVKKEGFIGIFKGLEYILLRQIPYTCVKLITYEVVSAKLIDIYNSHHSDNSNAKNSDDRIKLGIQVISGMFAGLLSAVVSHPADVLLSRLVVSSDVVNALSMNQNILTRLLNCVRCIGIKGCYAGVVPRAVMICFLSATQFVLYEKVKVSLRQRSFPNV